MKTNIRMTALDSMSPKDTLITVGYIMGNQFRGIT